MNPIYFCLPLCLALIGMFIYFTLVIGRYKTVLKSQLLKKEQLEHELRQRESVCEAVDKLTMPLHWHVLMERKEEWVTRRKEVCELLGITGGKYDSMKDDPKSGFPEAIVVRPGVRAWLRVQLLEWRATTDYFGN